MAVRKLKAKQRGPKCSWCDQRAVDRGFMFSRFACPKHRTELEQWDERETRPDHSDAAFYGAHP